MEFSTSLEHLQNRLCKNAKKLSKWLHKENVTCYRVYDADLPEYAAAIDIYNDILHIQEYKAPPSIPVAKAKQRLEEIIYIATKTFAKEKYYVKTRQKQKGKNQYQKLGNKENFIVARENNLSFLVNLNDYLDTGLFLDHRNVRKHIYDLAANKNFLNLFAYTGSATVYAASGNAQATTTVDLSNTYLEWAKENMYLNKFVEQKHTFIRDDCCTWLKKCKSRYDLIFLDPPTFSNSKKMNTVFHVEKDHPLLIDAAMKLLEKDGTLIFSTNSRHFELEKNVTKKYLVCDITNETMPLDFSKKPPIHKCWEIKTF